LREKFGKENVIAVGHSKEPSEEFKNSGPFEMADSRNKEELRLLIEKYNINKVISTIKIGNKENLIK